MELALPKLIRVTTVPVAMYKLLQGQLKYLKKNFDVIGICSRERYFDELSQSEEIKVLDVEIKRGIYLWRDFVSVLKLIIIFKREKPLIIHSHTGKAGFVAMIAGKLSGVPIRIQTFTGVGFETTKGFYQKLFILTDKITCYCATKIIPEGDGVKKALLKFNITKKPLNIIHNGNINGIDVDYFNPLLITNEIKSALRSSMNITDYDFVYCFIGRVVGDKGINELITSFDILSKKYSDIKLILVGPFENKLDSLKESSFDIIDNNNNIILTGLQQDVRPYLALSNLFVFPSYREGFPNVLLQAGAMGLPAIVTDVNGSNEIIINEYNGLIIEMKDVFSLTNAMERLYLNRDLVNHLSSKTRKRIVENFRREDVWEAILTEYQLLISNYKNEIKNNKSLKLVKKWN